MGSVRKQHFYNCEQIELRLKHEFPEYYKNISTILIDKYNLKENKSLKKREEGISRSLKVLYNVPLNELVNLKIQFVSGSKIVKVHQYIDSEESHVIVRDTDPNSGEYTFRILPYYSNFVTHFDELFQHPISISEIITQFDNLQEDELVDCADMVLDSITKYLLFGLLEFTPH